MISDAVLIQELARVLAQSLESALVPALVLVDASSNAVPLVAFCKRFGRPRDCSQGWFEVVSGSVQDRSASVRDLLGICSRFVRCPFEVRSGSFGICSESEKCSWDARRSQKTPQPLDELRRAPVALPHPPFPTADKVPT